MIYLTSTPVVIYLVIATTIAGLILLARHSFWLFSLLSLPGTFAHELTHWVTGFLTNAQPSKLSIIPRRNGDSYVLGSVYLRNVRWYNGWIVGFSPLLLLPAAYALALHQAEKFALPPSIADCALLYVEAQLLTSCLPSVQDMKVAFSKSWAVFLLAGILIIYANSGMS